MRHNFTLNIALWVVVALASAILFGVRENIPWIVEYPQAWTLPLSSWLNLLMDLVVSSFQGFFRGVAWLLERPMYSLQAVLHWAPWPATIALISLVGHRAGGWKLAAFCATALLYIVLVGYWDEAMNTLALVGVSVPISICAGFLIGIWGARSRRATHAIQVCLDFMQTVPAFAYLIPILLLFGFGPVVGLIASAIYAIPPMVRNVIVGLQVLPSDVLEAGAMSGCTPRQRFWWVEVPTAMPQILVGVNQCIMAALSMIIIASIIGGFEDIGWEVLNSMRKAEFGASLLSGLVIALMAMIMDRLGSGFADRKPTRRPAEHRFWLRGLPLALALTVTAAAILLGDGSARLPDVTWFNPEGIIDRAVDHVTENYGGVTLSLKNMAMFYFLIPLRSGLVQAVSPFSWGMELTPTFIIVYIALIGTLAAVVWRLISIAAAAVVAVLGVLFFFGTTETPWPVFILVVTLIAWQVGGWRVAAFCSGALMFILVNGLWEAAMLSVYLCGAAVVVCVAVGTTLGVWAAYNDRISTIVRPVNDTLQTMPQFVLLIPVLMLFQIGEFAALIAIVLYAVVPMVRYTEHGLRSVRGDIVEAARMSGCTRWQVFCEVKLPLAMPQMMLGLNQTILYGLAMLVIAALVGTADLGQEIYIALSEADVGRGLIAGVSIALIAMIADRIIQSWMNQRARSEHS